jgi:hypothetical protein
LPHSHFRCSKVGRQLADQIRLSRSPHSRRDLVSSSGGER